MVDSWKNESASDTLNFSIVAGLSTLSDKRYTIFQVLCYICHLYVEH